MIQPRLRRPLIVLFVAGCLFFAACQTTPEATVTKAPTATPTEKIVTPITGDIDFTSVFSARDNQQSYNTEEAIAINLSALSTLPAASGVTVTDGKITIGKKGVYVLSGQFTGQIVVDADGEKVQLVLNGVQISCGQNAPLYVAKADKVFITLAEGSENILTGGAAYSDAAVLAEITGVIYSKDDLTLNGAGKLIINAPYKHGIVSKDDLVITGGNYQINAASDGLLGKNSLCISGGTFAIEAGQDGLKSTKEDDLTKGYVYITGGIFAVTAQQDGVQAATQLQVTGGDFTLTTGGGYQNGKEHYENNAPGGRGKGSQTTDNAISAKGLKAGSLLTIAGGTFRLNCADDGLSCGGNLLLQEGSLTIQTGDDAAHADYNITMAGGNITSAVCYEGLEALSIDITGGTVDIIAGNDAVNAAGEGDIYVKITGGTIRLQAVDDGIDSNGDLIISGGTLYAAGPAKSEEGAGCMALDYGEETNSLCQSNGGTVLATGISAMSRGFQATSAQPSFYYSFGTNSLMDAGTQITVSDEKGNALITYNAPKQFCSVVFSSALLEEGKTYTLQAGSHTAAVTLTGMATNLAGSQGGPGRR